MSLIDEQDEFLEYDLPPVIAEEEEDEEPRGPRWRLWLLILLLLVMLGGMGYVYRAPILAFLTAKTDTQEPTQEETQAEAQGETQDSTDGSVPSSEETIQTTENATYMQFETAAKSKFFVLGGEKFFYCTKDGMKYFEGMSNQIWNQTFTLQTPSTTQKGEYVAVCELQGRNAMVYHTSGQVYAVQADGQILQYCLNENGALALLLKNGDSYKIQVFSRAGELMMERFEEDSGVYPLALSLSADEKILAVSYLDTTTVEMSTKVLLFYTTRADTEETETGEYFASVIEEGVVSPVLWCTDNGNFLAVSDHGIVAVAPDGTRAWSMELGNKITAVDAYGDYFAVAMGEAYPQAEGMAEGTVVFYSQTGQQMAAFETGEAVTYLKCSSYGTVVGCGHDFWAVSPRNGKQIWQYRASGDVQDILLVSKNRGLYVTSTTAQFQEFQ